VKPKSVASELDKILMSQGFDHPCRETCSGWKQGYERGQFDLRVELAAVKKENAALREALEHYADEENWTDIENNGGRIIYWSGKIARDVLEKFPKENK
jgi:hypothetical protein